MMISGQLQYRYKGTKGESRANRPTGVKAQDQHNPTAMQILTGLTSILGVEVLSSDEKVIEMMEGKMW